MDERYWLLSGMAMEKKIHAAFMAINQSMYELYILDHEGMQWMMGLGRQAGSEEAMMAAAGSGDPSPFLLSRYPRAIESNKLDERGNVQ